MKLIIILLALLTIAVTAIIKLVSRNYGCSVAGRFLERGPDYTAASLAAWVRGCPREAGRYAFPLLFPLDLLFMVFLGAVLAISSKTLASTVPSLTDVAWIFVVLPTCYLLTDFAEDVMLARFLVSASTITESAVTVAQTLTKVKILTLWGAFGQTVVLMFVAALSFFHRQGVALHG